MNIQPQPLPSQCLTLYPLIISHGPFPFHKALVDTHASSLAVVYTCGSKAVLACVAYSSGNFCLSISSTYTFIDSNLHLDLSFTLPYLSHTHTTPWTLILAPVHRVQLPQPIPRTQHPTKWTPKSRTWKPLILLELTQWPHGLWTKTSPYPKQTPIFPNHWTNHYESGIIWPKWCETMSNELTALRL